MYKISTLIEQHKFGFQVSSYVMFDKDAFNVDNLKDTFLELVDDAFVNIKLTQIIGIEDLTQFDTESQIFAYVWKLERNGWGWSYDPSAGMFFDLYEDIIKAIAVTLNYQWKIYQFCTVKQKRYSMWNLMQSNAFISNKKACRKKFMKNFQIQNQQQV